MTRELCPRRLAEDLAKLEAQAPAANRYEDAARLFRELIDAERLVEFLTLPAYEQIVKEGV